MINSPLLVWCDAHGLSANNIAVGEPAQRPAATIATYARFASNPFEVADETVA
jgi:hypothetical protein